MVYGLNIVQRGGQCYSIFTPQGIEVARLFMGADNQIFKDVECLKMIARIMAKRWDISPTDN